MKHEQHRLSQEDDPTAALLSAMIHSSTTNSFVSSAAVRVEARPFFACLRTRTSSRTPARVAPPPVAEGPRPRRPNQITSSSSKRLSSSYYFRFSLWWWWWWWLRLVLAVKKRSLPPLLLLDTLDDSQACRAHTHTGRFQYKRGAALCWENKDRDEQSNNNEAGASV